MAISIKSLSLNSPKSEDTTKKQMPMGTFEAILTAVKDGKPFRGREGYLVAYKRVYFTVGKAKYDCSLQRLCFPSKPVKDAVIEALNKGESVQVTMTSTVDARTSKLGYDVC